jgi:Carboxypeptidase regulatory-like domain
MKIAVRRVVLTRLLLFLFTPLLASTLSAQSQSGASISGVVRDTTGAVLPGVTVEASSPALIEKIRNGVSDDQGVYRIINLNPGTYTVTFTLPGFSTVKRDGLELTGGFTATVNAELRVGALEETVTVSGQSPLVDVQSATQRQTLTAQAIEDLPTARDASHMAVLLPGVTGGGGFAQDVGGTARPTGTHQLVIHGSKPNDWPNVHDGMQFGSMYNLGSGSAGVWQANPAAVEEYAIDTSGTGTDAASSGVRINIIPKQGGNTFTGYLLVNFANSSLVSSNIDDDMVARGVSPEDPLRKLWDVNPAFGGPLKKDKLWFYTAFRYTGLNEVLPNLFYDTNPDDFVFVRDTTRELLAPQVTHSQNLRLTWQTSRSTKLALYGDNVPKDRPINALGFTGLASYEATTHFAAPGSNLFQATWTAIAGRVLFELGETVRPDRWTYRPHPDVSAHYSGVLENATGARFGRPRR